MWVTSLVDMDKGVDAFILACHKAGNSSCAFWAPTFKAIRQNMNRLFENVKRYPVSVAQPGTGRMGPYDSFPALAEACAALSRGDGSLMLIMSGTGGTLECPTDPPFNVVQDSQTAVICNDGPGIPNDLESTQKYFAMMTKKPPLWGPFWARNRLGCICVCYPILVIGNTADPVTPTSGARKMAAGFTGSVLLTQDSAEHCSLNAPSVCTLTYIRNYFANGTLPVPGTVCSPEDPIFPDHILSNKTTRSFISSLTAEGKGICDVTQALKKKSLFRPHIFRRAV